MAHAWLEALGLETRLPDARFLEDVFLRFQRRVASETLTRPAGDPAAFDAAAFAAEWPAEERGLTGEERARAFAWLAKELGFEVTLEESLCSRPWAPASQGLLRPGPGEGGFSSKVNGGEAHRAAVASLEGRRIVADAGFPMPVLIPLRLPSMEIPSSFGTLSVASAGVEGDDSGFRVTCDARGEVADLLRLGPAPQTTSFPLEEIGRPLHAASPTHESGGSKEIFALRILDDRVLYWTKGAMTILDAWSVLSYPLAGNERAAFESLFALNLEGVDPPRVPAAPVAPTLTVFHSVALAPEDVRRGLDLETPPPSSLVTARDARIEGVGDGSRIALTATLGEPIPAAGPGESVRKTLVFHLAMDLLALGGGA